MKYVFILMLLVACAGADRTASTSEAIGACMTKATEYVFTERTCEAAQAKIDALQIVDANCIKGFGKRRIDACKLVPNDSGHE